MYPRPFDIVEKGPNFTEGVNAFAFTSPARTTIVYSNAGHRSMSRDNGARVFRFVEGVRRKAFDKPPVMEAGEDTPRSL